MAVVPDAPPATIDVMVASMADDASGEEERARALEAAAEGSGSADSKAASAPFPDSGGPSRLLPRLEALASRGTEVAALDEAGARKSAGGSGWARICFDDARASACAAVALAASLVYSQS